AVLGNVGELPSVIERSVIVSDADKFAVDESWLTARPPVESRLGLSGAVGCAREGDRRRCLARERRTRVRALGSGGPTRDPAVDARMEDSGAENQQESLSGA